MPAQRRCAGIFALKGRRERFNPFFFPLWERLCIKNP